MCHMVARLVALWLVWSMVVHGGEVNDSDGVVPELPPLEEHTNGVTQLEFGKKVKLAGLGPVIVNEDCTVRRIANWDGLSKQERDTAWRRIAARNNDRLMNCRELVSRLPLMCVVPSPPHCCVHRVRRLHDLCLLHH